MVAMTTRTLTAMRVLRLKEGFLPVGHTKLLRGHDDSADDEHVANPHR